MSAHRSMRLRHSLAMLGGAALAAALLAAPPSHAAPAPPTAPPATVDEGAVPSASSVITLISGDTARVSDAGAGQFAVAIEPASEGRAFNRYTDPAGDQHVVPVRLAPMIPDRLDPRLFNVSAL